MSTSTITESKEVSTEANGVTLRATFQVHANRVDVRFSVSNRSPVAVYITDFALDPKTSTVRDDSLSVAYEPLSTVVLWNYLPPLDPNRFYAHPPTAYTTRIAQGETYQNVVRGPSPLRVKEAKQRFGPNNAPMGWPGPVVECSQIRFDLGVIPESSTLASRRLDIAGRAVYELGTAAWKQQRIFTVETRDLTVPLVVE